LNPENPRNKKKKKTKKETRSQLKKWEMGNGKGRRAKRKKDRNEEGERKREKQRNQLDTRRASQTQWSLKRSPLLPIQRSISTPTDGTVILLLLLIAGKSASSSPFFFLPSFWLTKFKLPLSVFLEKKRNSQASHFIPGFFFHLVRRSEWKKETNFS